MKEQQRFDWFRLKPSKIRACSSMAEPTLDKRVTGVQSSTCPPRYEFDADLMKVYARLAEKANALDS